MSAQPHTDPLSADILIIGAGMAGLYTAWRLLRLKPKRRIRLLERLTGGRLETDHVLIDGVGVKTEEGGMRFLSTHVELLALLEQLGLSKDKVPFPMGGTSNLYYLRGKRFTVSQATADPSIWSTLFALNPGANGLQPGDILKNLLTAILKENHVDPTKWTGSTPDAWTTLRLDCTYRGIPLFRWGFWALLTDFGISADAIEMLYQSSGFIAPYDEDINAGCALQLLVDFVDPKFHTLGPGYETLPNALAAAITGPGADGNAGAVIHIGHEVQSIEREADGRYRIAALKSDGSQVQFHTTDLVIAVTQIALQGLIPYVPMFRESAQFVSDVNSVADMDLGKINLYYEKNWWTPATGITSGGSYTDLPLAQFYCFADQGHTKAGGPASITLYTDERRTAYWSQLQAIGEPYSVPNGPTLPPFSEAASTFVVAQATRQMQEMFGLTTIPAPLVATYRRWGVPPAGDGDHQWRIGVNDRDVRARLTNPFPHIYTCGETYSDDQAWVNGALRSVDQMLAAHFGDATS